MKTYKELYQRRKLNAWLDITTFCNAACPQCHRTNPETLNKVDDRVGEIVTSAQRYSVEETELNEKIKIYKENKIDKKFAQLEQYKLEKNNNQIEIDKLKIEVKKANGTKCPRCWKILENKCTRCEEVISEKIK